MEKESKRIVFKPISDGLGFHPFSDGLPYAPSLHSKRAFHRSQTLSQGEGAVSAGPPRMIFPKTQINPPVQAAPSPTELLVQTTPAPTQKSHLNLDPLISLKNHFGFNYVLKRVTSYLLDFLVHSSMLVAALEIFIEKHQLELFSNPQFFSPFMAFLFVSNWILTLTQELLFRQSVGKRMVNLKLNGKGSRLFFRGFLFLPSLGFFGMGLIPCLFDRRKRCWHDRAVSLQPEEV